MELERLRTLLAKAQAAQELAETKSEISRSYAECTPTSTPNDGTVEAPALTKEDTSNPATHTEDLEREPPAEGKKPTGITDANDSVATKEHGESVPVAAATMGM